MKTYRRWILFILAVFITAGSCSNFSFYSELDGAAMRINDSDVPLPGDVDTLSIIPASAVLPVGVNYTFSAEGGVKPYEFSLLEGAGTIDPESGIYTAEDEPGSAAVRVTDAAGEVSDADISLIVPGTFTISPSSITLYIYNAATFTALGGVKPYTFSVVSGSGSIDSASGAYTAGSSPGTVTVRVIDSRGISSDAAVTVLRPFDLAPSERIMTVGDSYTFTASGGKSPYTFSMESGSGSINSSSGEYTAPGSAGTDVIRATDALGNSRTAEITVIPAAALAISPETVTLVVGDTQFFSATGGTPPYTYSKYSGNGSFNVGTAQYSADGGPGQVVIRVVDNAGDIRDAAITVVSSGILTIGPGTAVIEQGTAFDFSAEGGTPPYSFTVFSGGGTVAVSTGLFTAPAALGTSTVRVSDSVGGTDDAVVDIAPAAPSNLVVDGTYGGPSEIELTWTDSATGEDGFKIERKPNGGAWGQITTVPGNTETYIDDDPLSPNTVYGYRVRAYFGTVNSSYSGEGYDIPNS